MIKYVRIATVCGLLIGIPITSRSLTEYVTNGASWFAQVSAARALLSSDNTKDLQQVAQQWLAHMIGSYRPFFDQLRTYYSTTEVPWYALTSAHIGYHEEALLYQLSQLPAMAIGAQAVTERMQRDGDRGSFLIDQLDTIIRPFQQEGWLASQANSATQLYALRRELNHMREKLSFLYHYIQYHRHYFNLYELEDHCWKQYRRELQAYRNCDGQDACFKIALQNLYLYEFRHEYGWSRFQYVQDLQQAVMAIHEKAYAMPGLYMNRVGAAQELAHVLSYIHSVAMELGW